MAKKQVTGKRSGKTGKPPKAAEKKTSFGELIRYQKVRLLTYAGAAVVFMIFLTWRLKQANPAIAWGASFGWGVLGGIAVFVLLAGAFFLGSWIGKRLN